MGRSSVAPRRVALRCSTKNGAAASRLIHLRKKSRQMVAGAIALADEFGYYVATLKVLHR
jgi:hypothetical protein